MYDFFSDTPKLYAEKSLIMTYFADLYTRVTMGRWSDECMLLSICVECVDRSLLTKIWSILTGKPFWLYEMPNPFPLSANALFKSPVIFWYVYDMGVSFMSPATMIRYLLYLLMRAHTVSACSALLDAAVLKRDRSILPLAFIFSLSYCSMASP